MKLPVTNEDLRTWFRQKWVRMDTKGNIKGDCAREEGEGKPKCLPSAKAHSMSKEDRAAAARRKRREDPVADRAGKGGKPINVKTMEEQMDLYEGNKPTNPALWSRAKALAKSKFDVYPSAYANGWAAKWYKSKGGGWKSVSEDTEMTTKTFFALREQLKTSCADCDDSMFGSIEEDFEPTGEEQYEDWDLDEAKVDPNDNSIPFEGPYTKIPKMQPGSKKPAGASRAKHLAQQMKDKMSKMKEDLDEAKDTETYKYIDQSGGQVIKGKSGTYVGYTHSATKGKGANILKHNQTKKYYAAGGSSTAFTAKTTLHDTPEDAARAYHKGNLAEAIKKPNATTRHLRDYPVSDKDVAKPVKTQKYEMMHRNGKVKRFVANNDADAKRIAAGHGAKSVIRLKGDVPAGKISEQGVAEGLGKNVVKSVKVGNFRHDLVDTGMGWQVRIYNGDELHDTGMSKNSEQKGLAALEDAVAYTEKQTRTKRQGVAEGSELQEAEKNGKRVQLNKPFRTSDGKGKFAVYAKNEKGNVVKVNFGDTTGLTIKTSNPDRRRNFRARHNCDNPGPKHKARYWSCKAWSRGTVSAGLGT